MAQRSIRSARAGEQGAVALIAALMLVAVFGIAALVIDLGSLYFTRRNLQAATDAAAMAAAYVVNSNPTATATKYLGLDGYSTVTPVVTPGYYCPLAATVPPTPGGRFSSSAACAVYPTGYSQNAVKVVASAPAPSFFAQVLAPGNSGQTISTTSIATLNNEAAFEVGRATAGQSAVAGQSLAAVNAVQTALLGSSVSLTSAAYQALISTDINAIELLNALAAQVGFTGTYGGLLSSTVSLYNVLAAAKTVLPMSDGVTDTDNALAVATTALNALTTLQVAISGSPTLLLSQLIDPGLLVNQSIGSVGPTTPVYPTPGCIPTPGAFCVNGPGLNLYDLATTAAETAFGTGVITIPAGNLGSTGGTYGTYTVSGVYAVTGVPQAQSAAIRSVGATLRTVPTRLQMLVTYAPVYTTLLGIPLVSVTITVPLVVNIGSGTVAASNGTASLTPFTCSPGVSRTATVAVAYAAAQAYIGTVTQAALANFAQALTVAAAPITVTSVLGIATFTVSGTSEVQVTAPAAANLTFSQTQMTAGMPQTVTSTGASTLLSTLGGSFSPTTTFSAGLLSLVVLQLDAPLVGNAVAGLLTPAFLAGLDPLVDDVLAGLGVGFGSLDVTATWVRCGAPSLVL